MHLEDSVTWTIVITTRNRAAMLKRAIESSLAQSNLSGIVVVDEGSTDDTPNLIKNFPTVQYIRNETPVGHSAAVNLGVKQAKSSWIKPLDDDDYLLPNCLETLTKLVNRQRISATLRRSSAPMRTTLMRVGTLSAGREVSLERTASSSVVPTFCE